MRDPYQVLGLAPETPEPEVRRRYLELVRRHPPDRDPERFNEIHEAYSLLRDPVVRMRKRLFEPDKSETLEDILMEARRRLRNARLPTDALLSLAKGHER